jgi:hypothetical protein
MQTWPTGLAKTACPASRSLDLAPCFLDDLAISNIHVGKADKQQTLVLLKPPAHTTNPPTILSTDSHNYLSIFVWEQVSISLIFFIFVVFPKRKFIE